MTAKVKNKTSPEKPALKVDTKQDVLEAMEKNPDMKWYIVRTAANCEDAAKKNIYELLGVRNVQKNVGMVLIPSKKVIENKNGQKKISRRKNYPTYIFVLAEMNESVMLSVREASKVVEFVETGSDKMPKAMNKNDVNDIIKQLDNDDNTAPSHKVEFTEGQSVRIENGPFKDFEAVVKKVNYDKEQLDVLIVIFGRETAIPIGFKEVSKI